eukprot:8461014-Pyramimonas_sp.AAC.1
MLPPTPKSRIVFPLWRQPPLLVLVPISRPPTLKRDVGVGPWGRGRGGAGQPVISHAFSPPHADISRQASATRRGG